jgi:hypothetical protein
MLSLMSGHELLSKVEETAAKRELFSSVRAFSPSADSPRISSYFQITLDKLAGQVCELTDFNHEDYWREQTFPGIAIDFNEFLTGVLKPVLPDMETAIDQLGVNDQREHVKRVTAESTEWMVVLTGKQRYELFDIINMDFCYGRDLAKKERNSDSPSVFSGTYFKFIDQNGNEVIFMPVILSQNGKPVISVAIPKIPDYDFYENEDPTQCDWGSGIRVP